MLLGGLTFSCNEKKHTSSPNSSDFSTIEVLKDSSNNIIMTKSGFADPDNFRKFKYYDTTGRLVFIIEWGGIENRRRMISLQTIDTGVNKILAGRYFYAEYLSTFFGAPNNFWVSIEHNIVNDKRAAFKYTDSIIYNHYKFHLSQSEFENLLDYLK